jgi:hypothetical protein
MGITIRTGFVGKSAADDAAVAAARISADRTVDVRMPQVYSGYSILAPLIFTTVAYFS